MQSNLSESEGNKQDHREYSNHVKVAVHLDCLTIAISHQKYGPWRVIPKKTLEINPVKPIPVSAKQNWLDGKTSRY